MDVILAEAASSWVDRVLGAQVDYITLAVPFFFVMIALELAFVLLARRDYVRFNDSLTALSCGMVEQTLGIFLKTFLFAGYIYVYDHYRLFEVGQLSPAAKVAAAIVLFFGVDFCFYWFHRTAHVMALPWATHVVHHSSEDLNLIVALRQSAFEDCLAWVFYLPLALLGFPPLWYGAMFSFNLIWQFWCHTRAVGKLGPIEWFFNTPSHHRVHHARNLEYLDKNYAGTLIIWDRMFGTFQLEQAEPVYGITKPLDSWNPLWANLHYWFELADTARRAPYLWDKVKIWFMPLGWTPRGLEPQRYATAVTVADIKKYNARVPLAMSLYVLAHFAIALLVGMAILIADEQHVAMAKLAAPTAWLLASLASFGGIFERRPWAWRFEWLRLAAGIGLAVYFASSTSPPISPLAWIALVGVLAVAGIASAVCLWHWRQLFSTANGVSSVPRGELSASAAATPPRVAASSGSDRESGGSASEQNTGPLRTGPIAGAQIASPLGPHS